MWLTRHFHRVHVVEGNPLQCTVLELQVVQHRGLFASRTFVHLTHFFSELSGKQEIFKPKRDPSRKVHIHRAGQRPGGVNDDEKLDLPPSKPKKGDNRALERARAKAMEGITENRSCDVGTAIVPILRDDDNFLPSTLLGLGASCARRPENEHKVL